MPENTKNYLIHFTIGGSVIKGESKITGYTDWFDGDADPYQAMHITARTLDYGYSRALIPTTKASWDIYGKVMKQDYGQVDIKIAQLSSDASKANYSSIVREYTDCEIIALNHSAEGFSFMFKARGSVGLSAEIPKEGGKTEKLGPSVYDLATNKPK